MEEFIAKQNKYEEQCILADNKLAIIRTYRSHLEAKEEFLRRKAQKKAQGWEVRVTISAKPTVEEKKEGKQRYIKILGKWVKI